jgi:hypothetical protein
MTTTYRGIGDACPYELVSGRVAGCPRFEPRVVFDRPDGSIVTCAHVRCSIARADPDDGTADAFYTRCVLRTGDLEAELAFVVPPD